MKVLSAECCVLSCGAMLNFVVILSREDGEGSRATTLLGDPSLCSG